MPDCPDIAILKGRSFLWQNPSKNTILSILVTDVVAGKYIEETQQPV